mmetsp:Transcript_16915/g.47477  ORF Transcript_16915/g.47477 Transcript_16915/m.47477 type:complete len:82 (+) Transcript_16915:1384-1629(+)
MSCLISSDDLIADESNAEWPLGQEAGRKGCWAAATLPKRTAPAGRLNASTRIVMSTAIGRSMAASGGRGIGMVCWGDADGR